MKNVYLLLFLMLAGFSAIAQTRVLTGFVKDSATNAPIQYATVKVAGKNVAATTGGDGGFSINLPTASATLDVSYVGYASQTITINADQTTVIILLGSTSASLNEVVVTALGISRQAKSLTYSVQKVSNDQLTNVKDANVVNSLTGKVAGVTIAKSTSGIGGSTRVIIRGNKSTRENQPLYVVDGVPLINFSPAQPGDEFGQSGVGYAGIDGGDGISNINPEDIESITVLKGASASTLYGSRGANGVILITTKKGRSGTTRVNVTSEEFFDDPLYKQPLQFKYGQTPNAPAPGSVESWGPVVNASDYRNNFFQTGLTNFTTISLSGGTDKSQSYFSYSYTGNKGIVPTSSLDKHNISFRQTTKFFNDKLTADINVLYTHQNAHNRPGSGIYNNPLGGLYVLPRGINFNQYKNQYEIFSTARNTNVQNWWNINFDSGYIAGEGDQNPYWLLYRNPSSNTLDRVYSNISLNYKFTSWLNLQARGNVDKSLNVIDSRSYATTTPVLTGTNGSYALLNAVNTQVYGDLLLTANKNLNDDLSLNATIGTSITDNKLNSTSHGTKTNGPGLSIANVFALANIVPTSLSLNENIQHRQVQAVFATASLGLKDFLYLDLSGRNDWSSTFAFTPTKNKGFFYYSAGLTGVLNQAFNMPAAINLAKLRASYASVGNDVNIYSTNPPPYYANFDAQQPTNKNNSAPFPGTYLRPEKNTSFEVGTEWQFLKNRAGFDVTYYENNNSNQYLETPAPNGSGLSVYYFNGGNIRNRGLEVSVNATPYQSKNVSWSTSINYAVNKNMITQVANSQLGISQNYFTITGIGNLLYASYIKEGGSWGDIYGRFFDRAADGSIIVDSTGAAIKGQDTSAPVGDKGLKLLGNPNPKFTLGWSNTINIGKFSIYFLVDGRFGGKVMSVTNAILDALGDSKATADARDAGGVNINASYADGSKFSGPINPQNFYKSVGGASGISEYYMYDATNIRLREASITYSFPFKNSFIKNLQFSVIGRNVLFFSKKAPFDPELSMSTNNGLQGVETFAIPSTRSIGASLKLGF